MSFEADYGSAGELLWRLRDLGTIVEIRRVEIQRPGGGAGADEAESREGRQAFRNDVRVTLTLFAYARTTAAEPPVSTSGTGR